MAAEWTRPLSRQPRQQALTVVHVITLEFQHFVGLNKLRKADGARFVSVDFPWRQRVLLEGFQSAHNVTRTGMHV